MDERTTGHWRQVYDVGDSQVLAIFEAVIRARRQLYIWVEQDDRAGSILELTNLLAWDIAPARLDERHILDR